MQAERYPTWAVNLWLSNDEGLYNMAREIVADCREQADEADDVSVSTVADAIEEMVRELIEMDEASLRTDLLGWALDSVDWQDIARSWIDES